MPPTHTHTNPHLNTQDLQICYTTQKQFSDIIKVKDLVVDPYPGKSNLITLL